MNLSIRNDLPSLKNLQNAQANGRAATLYPSRTAAETPPGMASPELTAKLQSTMKEQFAAKAQDPRAFHDLMFKVYGEGYDQNKAEALRQKALGGDFSWLPPVRLLDSATLQGANGAYDAKEGVVYINADLAAKNPKLAASTYVEEAGAHLDSMLNRADSAGDEGELFRRVMSGEKLSTQDVAAIRAEDDHGTIVVDGKEVNVEFWSLGGALKAVGGAIKSGAKAIGQAVKKGASVVTDKITGFAGGIASTLVNAGTNLARTGKTLFGGIGKMTVGFVGNLVQGKIGDAFKSFTSGVRDVTFGTAKGLFRTGFSALGDALKIPTNLLPDSIGSKIRNGIDKAKNFVVEQSVFATELFARILIDLPSGPINDFVGDLESAVKKGLTGDLSGFAKGFGSAFANLPGGFKDRFLAIFDTSKNDIQADL